MNTKNEFEVLADEIFERKDSEDFKNQLVEFLRGYAYENYSKGWADGKIDLPHKTF